LAYKNIARLAPDAIEAHLALIRLGVPLKHVLAVAPKTEWIQIYITSHAKNLAHEYQEANAGFIYLEKELFPGNVDLMLKLADLYVKLGDVNKGYLLYMKARKADLMLIDDMDKYAGLIRQQGKSILVNHLAEDLLKVSDSRPECFVILARFSEMNNSLDRALVFLDKVGFSYSYIH
jgi:hypothetical protein